MRAFSLLISEGKLSKFAHTVASSGRLLAKNMMASDCIAGYAELLESVLTFPSDVELPGQISQLKRGEWEWNLFRKEMELSANDMGIMDQKSSYLGNSSIVYVLEEEFTKLTGLRNGSQSELENLVQDIPSDLDWDILTEIENSEEVERLEQEEVFLSFFCKLLLFCYLLLLYLFILHSSFSFWVGLVVKKCFCLLL